MTNRDFRLLTARVTLAAPVGPKPVAVPKPNLKRVSLSRRVSVKAPR